MLNHADSIDRKIEKLPISVVNRNLAQANNPRPRRVSIALSAP